MHWTSKYISTSYKDLNCAELVEKVLFEQFGLKFKFPQSNGDIFYESHLIKESLSKFVDTEKTENPKEGDLVLMHAQTRMCHVGLFVEYRGLKYVLHSLKSVGSVCLHKISDLNCFGIAVAGYYKWQK